MTATELSVALVTCMRATARREATMLRAMPLSVARSPSLDDPCLRAYSRASRSSLASSRSMAARERKRAQVRA